MDYFSPDRPTLGNGNRCWVGTHIALPDIILHPIPTMFENGHWLMARIMVYSLGAGHWAECKVDVREVERLMLEWEQDPEDVLNRWFLEELPKDGAFLPTTGERTVVETTQVLAADLGL